MWTRRRGIFLLHVLRVAGWCAHFWAAAAPLLPQSMAKKVRGRWVAAPAARLSTRCLSTQNRRLRASTTTTATAPVAYRQLMQPIILLRPDLLCRYRQATNWWSGWYNLRLCHFGANFDAQQQSSCRQYTYSDSPRHRNHRYHTARDHTDTHHLTP